MDLPRLSLAEWEDTRLYLQLVCQIVGKTRLKLHPPLNHWWHVTLYLCGRGLTTGGIPVPAGELEITVDLVSHEIVICRGAERESVLLGASIQQVYHTYTEALQRLGIAAPIDVRPYKCRSTIPFPEDREHASYDPAAAERAFAVLSAIEGPFKEFRGRFLGKCSPVQMYWHSFDLACTRFSGRAAPTFEADRVTMAAYSHEVISAGFWFGDDQIPEAAFYCYTAPSPEGLDQEPLSNGASWRPQWGSPMAIVTYEHVRGSTDPRRSILEFLQTSYEAGARKAAWNRAELELGSREAALLAG